jgi:ribosomal protein S18 acetylase RimI-like enzyme
MYTVRRAELKDIPVIVSFRIKMFRSFMGDSHDFDRISEFENRQLREDAEKNQFVAWVAETEDGEIVACSAVSFYKLPPKPWNLEGNYGFISSMFTEPDHRRRGLGTSLLQAALDYTSSQGITHVTLHASEKGKALYQSFGFTDTNEMRLVLPDRCGTIF